MQVAQADQLVGKKLGAYRVEHLLGHGQLSAVYLARQVDQDRTALMTIFHYPETISAQEHKQLGHIFAQEGAALVHLRHPNILQIYDVGEQSGHPYLVTAYARGASLAQLLKQQARLTPEQTLRILQQLADGLDYAHTHNVIHGNLSLSNILVSADLAIQIAGFGLRTMLEARRDRHSDHPQAHLLSAKGIFLGNPAYIAPERVRGLPTGALDDIYALGIMLYELLSGGVPFHGATPLETALQRIQQPTPLLCAACPDLAAGFDLVIGKALAPDPARRYQRAGEVAKAFERTLKTLEVAHLIHTPFTAQPPTQPAESVPQAADRQITLLTDINSPAEQDMRATGKWQLIPPVVTGQLEAVPHRGKTIGDSLIGADPFAWWTATTSQSLQHEPGTFTHVTPRSTVRLANPRGQRRVVRQDRRQVLKLITTGAVIGGVFAAGGITFARFAQSIKQTRQFTTSPSFGSTTITRGNTPTTGTTQAPQHTPTATRTAAPQPSPTHAAQPTPTAQPTHQPTPQPTQPPPQPSPTPSPTPGHTGTVIGSTSQPTNSAVQFSNPADGQDSLLIHLSNGNFVSCERACTHQGVDVNYDTGQMQLVCPAHGAIFDPLNGFAHLSGPGNGPLATVNITVNADGTITTG